MSEGNTFKEEQIVWSKIKGYPWWPASVHEVFPQRGTVMVNYIMDFSQ